MYILLCSFSIAMYCGFEQGHTSTCAPQRSLTLNLVMRCDLNKKSLKKPHSQRRGSHKPRIKDCRKYVALVLQTYTCTFIGLRKSSIIIIENTCMGNLLWWVES